MRRLLLVISLLGSMAPPALADCRDEVSAALERQRKASAYRATISTVNERGPIRIDMAYVLPDRMHQTVKVVLEPGATETILVGSKAWIKRPGGNWEPLPQADMNELRDRMLETVVEAPKELADYECLGKTIVDGEELVAYRRDDRTALPTGKKVAPPEGTPERILYVHPLTGLPMRDIAAPRGRPEKPFHKTVYSYAQDILVEPPAAN
jgi:hypothetical protein